MSEYDFYPEKPELEKQTTKKKPGMTVFTMALFVISFLLLFSDSLWFVLSLLVVLYIHELGHFAFMKLYKYKHVRMLFVPLMGAFVQGIKDKYSQWQSFVVVLAGPLPGVLIGVVLFFLAQAYQQEWFMTFSLLFIFLNVLNLLPLDPLDGGQLLRLLIKGNQDLFQLIFSFISSLTLIGVGFYLESWILMGFGFLMGVRVRNIQKNYNIRKELKEESVDFVSTYADLTNREYARIKQVVIDNNNAIKKYLQLNNDTEDLEPMIANQVNNILVPPMERDTSILTRITIVVLWVLAFVVPVLLFQNASIEWYVDFLRSWR